MKTRFKKVLCAALSATMALSLSAPIASAANDGIMLISTNTADSAVKKVEITKLDAAPTQDWAVNSNLGNNTDNTLVFNSLVTFTGYRDQGEVYVTPGEGNESFRMFVNNAEVDVTEVKAGATYKVDISDLTVDGTNTVQISARTPYASTVNVKVAYPTVITADPEDVGMDAETLKVINDFMNAETKYGFSGAQLAVIKDGKLVINEAWGAINGYRTDSSRIVEGDADYVPVTTDTLYDLASNTKMYSVNYAIQYMLSHSGYDIALTDPITKFFPEFANEETTIFNGTATADQKKQQAEWKAELTVEDILKHQAGFPADPQYHKNTFRGNDTTYELYSQDRETTLKMVLGTPLNYEPGTKTVYSDVDYMLLCFVVEKVSGKGMDEFLKEAFWDPMGLTHITYNPLENGFEVNDCAATELDGNHRTDAAGNGYLTDFNNCRTGVVQGTVHDEKAYYCMDGVSGHAGLFSNAEDLAKLASLMLTGGYEGKQYFTNNVMDKFTAPKSTDYPTWGLGWWRQGDVGRRSYFSTYASTDTIGHQGWTGTMTLIDPDENLVVVFLTNKKNSPVMDNTADGNDFSSDNYIAGGLGVVNGFVYDAFKSSAAAMDGKIAQMAYQRIEVGANRKNAYDVYAHCSDSFAMLDLVITRAESRPSTETVGYAQWVYDLMKSKLFDSEGKAIDTYFGSNELWGNWWTELTARYEKLTASTTSHAEATTLKAVKLDTAPALFKEDGTFKGGDQNAVFMPRAYGFSTATCYDNTNFWFEGYKGQGVIYISRYNDASVNLDHLEIFVNGHAVDVSEIKANNKQGAMFAIDVSEYTINGRNMVQFSGISNTSTRSLLVAAANPEVIEGTLEEVGIDAKVFDLIDNIITSDIEQGFPSAQMSVIKDGKLVYSNAWGAISNFRADGSRIEEGDADYIATTTDTLFDLASNTKMYSVNYAIQYLIAQGKMNINDKITKYFPEFADEATTITTGDKAQQAAWKAELTIADILQHQAGFPSDPQYYLSSTLFSQDRETTLKMVLGTPLDYEPGAKTLYSDVDYMLLGFVIEKITGKDLDTFLKETFWEPMGLENITYNPLDHGFTTEQIAATELDGDLRGGQVDFVNMRTELMHGTVHDGKAYFSMEGISGHAGIFSTADDLATLAAAMLNPSGYGENKFFSTNINDYFTSPKAIGYANWGQGWWREGNGQRAWYFGIQSSRDTFGHQGWTGTLTTIDPDAKLSVAFLTNKLNTVCDMTDHFDGNDYTTSTLGFANHILYMGLAENNVAEDIQPALDALAADMAETRIMRSIKNGASSGAHSAALSVNAMISVVEKIAEARPTAENKAALEKLMTRYNETITWMPFTDVEADHWFYVAVKNAYDKGLFEGVDRTSFNAADTLTQAMLVTVLYRAAGEPEVDSAAVTGVTEGQHYTNAAKWALNNKLIESFDPTHVPTREEVVVILFNHFKLNSKNKVTTADISSFADAASVSANATEAMKWAVKKKIIKGDDSNKLNPQSSINRAELATLMLRYF